MERTLKRALLGGSAAVLPFLTTVVAHAQTSTTTPNTGAGGDAIWNVAIMLAALAIAIAGAVYLRIAARRG